MVDEDVVTVLREQMKRLRLKAEGAQRKVEEAATKRAAYLDAADQIEDEIMRIERGPRGIGDA